MPVLVSYMPNASSNQISAIMEGVQNIAIELGKNESDLTFDFIDAIKEWLLDDSVFPLVINHSDLHAAHDGLNALDKLYCLDNVEEIKKSFGNAEKLQIGIKKIISPTKPDFVKYSREINNYRMH